MDIQTIIKQHNLKDLTSTKTSLEERLNTAHQSTEKIDISQLSEELVYTTTLHTHTTDLFKIISSYNEAQEIIDNETDTELIEMAKEELKDSEETITKVHDEIVKMKITREFYDPDDNKPAILEIRAGAGGEEASLFAADLFRMYSQFGKGKGWDVQVVSSSISENGGYKEVIAQINGKNVFKALKYESGVHRVQRIPVTESSGRIHTSTASVAVLPEAEDVQLDIQPEEIKTEVMRASGAGGQCVNKTDSAVRLTHLPSGIVVSCQETKYQHQNKEKAMKILRARLYEQKKEEEAKKRSDMRVSQIGTSMRSEKIRTYNIPQMRITDHRIKKSWHNVDAILNGDIEDLVTELKDGIEQQAVLGK